MQESLWKQLRITANSETELIEAYRRVYLDTYVLDENGKPRVFSDWRGETYRFSARAFDHAFTESKNYRTSNGIHDGGFSKKRARRILWIKEVLAESAGTISKLVQSRKNNRGQQVKRRTLIVLEERYVVVFNDPKKTGEAHQFITAFPADQHYIAKVKRESFIVETRRGGRRL
ncbi:MAG: hypothetical protein ACI9XU_000110 [Arenicella sp.]|jgi:hypothetical protein